MKERWSMNKHWKIIYVTCGFLAGIIAFEMKAAFLGRQSAVIITSSGVPEECFPIMSDPFNASQFYKVPDSVTTNIRSLMMTSSVPMPEESDIGKCRAHGYRIRFGNKVVQWYSIYLLSGDQLYIDSSGRLAEYFQFATLLSNHKHDGTFGSRFEELDILVDKKGNIDVAQLKPDSKELILRMRKRLENAGLRKSQ